MSCVPPSGGYHGPAPAPAQTSDDTATTYSSSTYSDDSYAADDGNDGGWPRKECLSEYGTTECGYHCVAQYGEVKCASTPTGACQAQYGTVTCWDPPRGGRRHHGYGRAAQAECVSQYGTTACGYGCVAQYGEVKCAQHPGGVCAAQYGSITCSD
jgi:hypothetical protein